VTAARKTESALLEVFISQGTAIGQAPAHAAGLAKLLFADRCQDLTASNKK
jgi:hypothetical protein